MEKRLPNCWEREKCGREEGGSMIKELGVCIASKEKMGHSCWAIAGTLCAGKVQCTVAQKIGFCTSCEVHKIYNRSTGKQGKEIADNYPEEDGRYKAALFKNSGIV